MPVRCAHCSRPLDPFGRCRRRTCPHWGRLVKGDWEQAFLVNGLQLDSVMTITLTGPGVDAGLPWDRDVCTHPGDEKCSGSKGCRVVEEAAAFFNSHCEAWSSRLHRAVAARVARRLGPGSLIAFRSWEPQQRGIYHAHIALPYGTPRERARADCYAEHLEQLRERYGFGFVKVKRSSADEAGGVKAAVYAAKYFAKNVGETAVTGIRRPAYIGRFLTLATGITIRALRWRRFLWHKLGGLRLDREELRNVIELFRTFPGLELDHSAPGLAHAPPLPAPFLEALQARQ